MSDEQHENRVRTQSVARRVARTDDIELAATPTTRTTFRPTITEHGVRGEVVRQKQSADGEWSEANSVDFRSAPAGFTVRIDVPTDGVSALYEALGDLYEVQRLGVRRGRHDFIVGPAEEMIRVTDHDVAEKIRAMIDRGHSAQMWEELASADPDLADRLAAARLQVARREAILSYAAALDEHGSDEAFWQQLFEEHPWMLQCASAATVYVISGDTYIGGKLPYGRSGKGGVATDFVTADESTKSFGVVEIKTPNAELVGSIYRGDAAEDVDFDNVVYSMHSELSGAVVQTRNQIAVAIEGFRETLERHHHGREINRLHPKGILVTGVLRSLSPRQQISFNQFRHGMHSLTIITFDELLRRLAISYEVDLPDQVDEADLAT